MEEVDNKFFCVRRLSILGLSTAFVLLSIVWVLPHTAAIRNILLGIGLIFSLIYIFTFGVKILINRKCLPLILIYTLFIWVGIHWLFFSLDIQIESKEIKGIWVRSAIGILLAIILAIEIKETLYLKILFAISLCATPFINLGFYIFHSFQNKRILLPNEFVSRFLFNKIEVAFFGVIAISFFLAWSVIYLSEKYPHKRIFINFILIPIISILLLSLLISASKNGVLISLLLLGIFFTHTFCQIIFKNVRLKSYLLIFFIFIILFVKIHHDSAAPGWTSLLKDIETSLQVEKHQHWKKFTKDIYPFNDLGQPVAGNTYERVAWATVGWSLIKQEPFGYGSINHSFKGMLDYQKIAHNVPGQTHSGWTDFALAFGIPGLSIIIFSQLAIIYLGLKRRKNWDLVAVWICLALLPLGVIAEICYKQYFEATLFFIAFAATLVCDTKAKESANNSESYHAK